MCCVELTTKCGLKLLLPLPSNSQCTYIKAKKNAFSYLSAVLIIMSTLFTTHCNFSIYLLKTHAIICNSMNVLFYHFFANKQSPHSLTPNLNKMRILLSDILLFLVLLNSNQKLTHIFYLMEQCIFINISAYQAMYFHKHLCLSREAYLFCPMFCFCFFFQQRSQKKKSIQIKEKAHYSLLLKSR